MKHISADYIFDGHEVLKNKTIVYTDEEIIKIVPTDEVESTNIEYFSGWIIPGMVNTHCHLELSHMKGSIPTGTGLIDFITRVVTQRAADEEEKQTAMAAADNAMWQAGIDVVGDIANTTDAVSIKNRSKIHYHTFVEAFDLLQAHQAEEAMRNASDVYATTHKPKSIVAHAPYSCSSDLLKRIMAHAEAEASILSVHNQETLGELELFSKGSGDLIRFYETMGIDLSDFQPDVQNSLGYYRAHLSQDRPHLFVHNTLTTIDDARLTQAQLNNTSWVTCANANLYIENKLPDYAALLGAGAIMSVGTDSLASNWSLSIWDELCTIKKYNSYIDDLDLLRWATAQGARALGLTDTYGTLAPGAKSGLLHLTPAGISDTIVTSGTILRRIK